MNQPQGVKQAVITIWATLLISGVVSLADKLTGQITEVMFFFTLIFYGLLCILPYKIGKRSNPARYVYVVLTGISFLIMASGAKMPQLDYIAGFLMLPVEIFIVYRLFTGEAKNWFAQSNQSA